MCDHLREGPPIQNTKTFLVKALQLEPLENDHHLLQATANTLWAFTFNDFPLFLTSCKRPLDACFDPYVRCVLCYLEYTKNG